MRGCPSIQGALCSNDPALGTRTWHHTDHAWPQIFLPSRRNTLDPRLIAKVASDHLKTQASSVRLYRPDIAANSISMGRRSGNMI